MEKFLLKLVSLFRPLFVSAGIDFEQMKSIVAIKLQMDNRRQLVAYRKQDGKEPTNSFLQSLFFYGIFGGIISLVIAGVSSFMLGMIFFFSFLMVMIAMTLITDFSSILLDTSDNTIILPRPVSSRTVFSARLVHILLYLGQITTCLSLIPLIVVAIKFNVFLMLLMIVAITLSVVVAVFLTNTVYLLIMQFASEEKLKNIINYFQIIMAVCIVGGYQIMPRLIGRLDMETTFEIHWWNFLVPPIWMAGFLEMFYIGQYDWLHLGLTACAVVLPLVGVVVVNKYLTPIFNRKLGSMGMATERVSESDRQKGKEGGIPGRIGRWITRGPIEFGAFQMIQKTLARDRKLKLKIYPVFGYIFVFGLIFMMRGKEDLLTTWNNLPNTSYYIVMLYLTIMVLQTACHEVAYSDEFKASWIYFSSPLDKPGEILMGTVKAIFVRLFLPIYAVVCVIVLAIWRWDVIDDLIFGFFNSLVMLLIIVSLSKKYLPLSQAANLKSQAGNFARGLMIILLTGLLGLGHYLLAKIPFLLLGAIPVELAAIYLMHRSFKATSWEEITL